MRKLKKIVGGFFHPEEKSIDFPPANSLEMELNKDEEWITIQVQKTRKKETER